VRIALAVAERQAQSEHVSFMRPPAVRSRGRVTAAALVGAGAAAVWLPLPSLSMAVVDLAVFAALTIIGLRTLGDIGDAARPAAEASEPVRLASLQPRRLANYVPPVWRATLFSVASVALAGFAWRLMLPAPGRRLLLPIAFAACAPVFAWLYEAWMRDLATGGDTPSAARELRRRQRVRRVFAVEALLVTMCLVLAHALLDLDCSLYGAWGAGAGLLGGCAGIVGCALLVSSELARRRYRLV
jgi:hypothetical protein